MERPSTQAVKESGASASGGDCPLSMKLLIMNANGDSDGKGTADRRKKCISDTIAKQQAELVLFQEFKWTGVTGRTWKDSPISEDYKYTGNTEASMLYDSRNLIISYPTQLELLRLLEEMIRLGELPMDFSPFPRMCIRIVERKEAPKVRFVCVSWHGRYKGKEETLLAEFKDLLIYLKKFCRNKALPLLLAGDFNLRIEIVRKHVSLPLQLYEYTPLKRRTGNVIDYFIATTWLKLDHVTPLDLNQMTEADTPYHVLDHDPVSALLQLYQRPKLLSPMPASRPVITKGRQKSTFKITKNSRAPRSQ